MSTLRVVSLDWSNPGAVKVLDSADVTTLGHPFDAGSVVLSDEAFEELFIRANSPFSSYTESTLRAERDAAQLTVERLIAEVNALRTRASEQQALADARATDLAQMTRRYDEALATGGAQLDRAREEYVQAGDRIKELGEQITRLQASNTETLERARTEERLKREAESALRSALAVIAHLVTREPKF